MAYYKCGTIHPTQNSNVVVDTASGVIANFQTPLAMPLKSLKVDVNAVQDLHGQSGAYPTGCGVNKFDKDTMVVSGYYIADTDGQAKPDSGSSCTDYIEINPDTSYYIKTEQTVGQWAAWYDENKNYISGFTMYNRVVTSPSTAKYIRLTILRGKSGNINTFSVNYPSTDTAYHPYSNICPINGWDEISVHNLGGNFFNKNTITSGLLINSSGNEVSYADWNISDFIPVVEGARYYLYGLTVHPNTNQDNFELFNTSKVKVGYANVKTNEQPYVIPSGVAYIKCCVKNQDLDTAQFGVYVNDSFVPYNPVIEKTVIDLGGTYYGGRFIQDKDGKRKFEVTREIIDLGEINWHYSVNDNWFQTAHAHKYPTSNNLCSCYPVAYSLVNLSNKTIAVVTGYLAIKDTSFGSDENAFKTAMTGQKLVYELATPTIIDLPDGTPFKSLPGVNNIFADTGDTSLQFAKIGN